MSEKHSTVIMAELARDMVIASSAKHPTEQAAAFKLLYLTIQKATESSDATLETRIDAALKELREAEPKLR